MGKKVAKKPTRKPAKASPAKTKAKPKSAKTVVAEIVDNNHEEKAPYWPEEAETDKSYIADKAYEEDLSDPLLDEEENPKSQLPQPATRSIVSTDPLTTYLSEIRKFPVLSKEQELEIAKKYYETKDPKAAELLVRSNLRFVVKIAAEYSKFGAKMIDLIQEGNVGLMQAVRDFNPYKGARVITYAVWWIRGYIQEYLMRQYSMVRIGTTQNQRKLFYQLQKEKKALELMGRDDSLALISSRLGIPEDEVQSMAQRMSGRDVSLDRPVGNDSQHSLLDLQRAATTENLDDQLAKQEQLQILKEKIEEIRPQLSEREKIILDERILNDEPLTLQEIGEKYGITREAVRQMEVRVMKKIRDRMDVP